LAGGTMSGDLTILRSYPQIKMQRNDVAKGGTPSANIFWSIGFCDKNGVANANRLGLIESRLDTSKNTLTQITAYRNVADATESASVQVWCLSDGTKYATCPTPAATDSSTKIATTAWVKARLGNTEFGMVPSDNPVSKTVGTQYTASTNGFFKVEHNNNIGNSDVVVTINGHETYMHSGQYGSGGQHSGGCCFFPVKKGWTYKCTKANWCGFQSC
jgi:hypothetical protein